MEWAVQEAKMLEHKNLEQVTDSFVKSLCADGELTDGVYSAFCEKISAGHGVYRLEIECLRKVYEPDESGIGEVFIYECFSGNNEIMEDVFEKGRYQFVRDDIIKVTLGDNKDTLIKSEGRVSGEKRK